MMNYSFRELVIRLLPSFIRKPKWIAFIFALLAPLRKVFYKFRLFVRDRNNMLLYNSQTGSLRALLQSKFASAQIDVVTTEPQIENAYVYWEIENQPQEVYTDFFALWQHEFDIQVDFEVRVPATLHFDEPAMISVVNYYKLAGKKFKIVYF